MTTRNYQDYLRDILEYIEKAERFATDTEFDEFQQNDMQVEAIVRTLEVIGEAVKYIPDHERSKYPQIPWRAVAGMRDKLIHGYFTVDLRRVWETVQRDLPPLYQAISKMFAEIEQQNAE